MISVTVNYGDAGESHYPAIDRASLQEAFEAVRLLHPEWTSIVITIVNRKKESK